MRNFWGQRSKKLNNVFDEEWKRKKIEGPKSTLNQGKKQIRFTNTVVYLWDRLCTGEIKIIELNYEYDLQITANSMLVNASAGFKAIWWMI